MSFFKTQKDSYFTIFDRSIYYKPKMKSSEFIREATKNGWQFLRQGKGSHEIYEKNGKQVVIPNHGSKELGKGLELKLRREMKL
jgi:mRNA interferase HicA